MSTTKEYLVKEYAKAVQRLAQSDESERQVRALLERADARRAAEPGEYRRWSRVVDRLEVALDYAKAMQAHWEGEVVRRRRRAEKNGVAAEHLDQVLEEQVQAPLPEEAPPVLDAAQATLQELNEEDHQSLHEIAQEVQADSEPGQVHAEPRQADSPPKRTPVSSRRSSYPSLEDRRRLRRLRQAVDKLVGGHYDLLTLRETALVFEAQELWEGPGAQNGLPQQVQEALRGMCVKMRSQLEQWEAALEDSHGKPGPKGNTGRL